MYNWSVDTKRLKKNSEEYIVWKLEQTINFGLGKDRLDARQLKKYFGRLNIDPDKKEYLNFILYG